MTLFKISRFTIELPILHQNQTVWALFNTLTKGFVLNFDPIETICSSDLFINSKLFDDLVHQGFILNAEVDETAVFES